MTKRGEKVIVVGAGVSGLSAAAAASPFFDAVVVLEKDALSDAPEIRSGAIQGAHIHTMLRGGEAGLQKLLPGIRDDFLNAGAVELDMGADYVGFDFGVRRAQEFLDMPVIMMSRPGYEQVMRDRVKALGNVDILSGRKVDGIEFSGERPALRIDDDNTASSSADLIIDARGRGAPILNELKRAGYPETPHHALGISMCYVSGRFRRSPAHRDSRTAMLVRPDPPDCRYGIVFPIEGGDWIITLGGRNDVVPPTDPDGFFDYIKQTGVQDFYDFVEGAELVGKLWRYRKPTAHWRRFDQMNDFPDRFLPIGDTITSINPTFGQGMTLGVLQANGLRSALEEFALDDPEFRSAYFRDAMSASEMAWDLAKSTDLQYPFVTGERPEGFEQAVAFSKGLRLVAAEDKEIQRLVMEVFHMEKSSDCLRDPAIIQKVMTKLKPAATA